MNPIISVLFVLLMLVVLVFAIMKKFNIVMSLWLIGTIGLFIIGAINGAGAAAASSGNALLDAFEYFKECCGSQFAGNALLIVSVMGYVGYMNYLKAGDLFAVYVARPLQKLKAKWLVVGLVVLLDWIFVMVLPSGVATVALLFGTLYPVMLYLGVDKVTAGSAIVVGVGVFATPANFFAAQMVTDLQLTEGLAVVFVKQMLPIVLIMEVFFILAFVFDSKRAEKKAIASGAAIDIPAIPDPKSFNLPWFYALLPLIPFVAIIGFSKLFFENISLSVVAANMFSFFVALLVRVLSSKKSLRDSINEGFEFFKGLGNAVAPVGMILVAGTFFAGALSATGGLNVIVDFLVNKISLPVPVFIVFCSVLAALMYAATGSPNVGLYAICPLLVNVVFTAGEQYVIPALLIMTISSNILGAALSPISAANMFAAGFLDVPVTTVVKRCTPAAAVAFVVSIIATFIIF